MAVAGPVGPGRGTRMMEGASEIYPMAKQEARRQVLTDSFSHTRVRVDSWGVSSPGTEHMQGCRRGGGGEQGYGSEEVLLFLQPNVR